MDYVAVALSRLINQFENSPHLQGLVAAMVAPIQTLEGTALDIKGKRWIDAAEGKQLDGAGYIVGETRLGRNDDDYREAIKFRIFVNTSNATPQDLIRGLQSLTKPDDIQYIEQYPATAMLFTDGGAAQFIANDEVFGVGNGSQIAFQLSYDGRQVFSVGGADVSIQDWRGKQLIYNAPRTNLLTYSEQFDNAAWTRLSVTVTPDAAIAPDGTLTADKLIDSVDNGNHQIGNSFVPTIGVEYSFSVYAKAAELSQLAFGGLGLNGAGYLCIFDLVTQSIINAPPGSMLKAVGDGWFRCSVPFVATAAVSPVLRTAKAGAVDYVGDGVSGIYFWGAQLETSSAATSYIPTTSAAVTRSADTIANGLVTLSSPPTIGAILSWTGNGGSVLQGGNIQEVMQSLAPAAISDVPVMVSYSRKSPFRFGREAPPSELFVNSDADYLTANGADVQVQVSSATAGPALGGIALADLFVGDFMLDVWGSTLAIDSPNYNTVLQSDYQLPGVYQ